jgi:hypothetical protein
MLDETQKQERNCAGVRRWYSMNREAYNALRRERYAADEEARAKARQRAADYRMRGDIPITRELTRVLNGVEVNVFSTGQVAKLLGRSPQMLRNWEKAGLIPASVFPDKHRFYTKAQVDLLIDLASAIYNHGGWTAPEVKAEVRQVHKNW